MRFLITMLAGLLLSATLPGCSGSAAIPQPPSQATDSPPPGSSPEMANSTKKAASGGGMGAAMPTGPATR